jgi:4-hydroxybenzoate polyprenyltransferase
MIQRIQTIWLILAASAGAAMYKLPLWKGKLADGTFRYFSGSENLLLFITIIVTTLIALFTIFMFKDRRSQKSLCILGILLSFAILAMEFFMVDGLKKAAAFPFQSNYWQIGAVIPIVMIVFFSMARSGIRKDEKMLRDLEKLR